MADDTNKTRNVNALDATGEQVAKNIKRLRGGMTYRELSDRLAASGRKITVLGLRRIEAGERKVDVDDLMALAVVFGVSPLTLLLPEYAEPEILTHITGYPHELGSNVAWIWARGDEPLEVPQDPSLRNHSENDREILIYRYRARPDIEPRTGNVSVSTFPEDDARYTKEQEQEQEQEQEDLKQLQRRYFAQGVRPAQSE